MRRAAIALLVGLIAATVFLLIAVPSDHLGAVSALMEMDAANAQLAMANWDHSARESFRFLLGFDFLYDLLHNNAAAFFLVWGAQRVERRATFVAAAWLAWIMWLDSALNVVEALLYLHILDSGSTQPWHTYGSAIFHFRTVSLGIASLTAVGLHVGALFRPR